MMRSPIWIHKILIGITSLSTVLCASYSSSGQSTLLRRVLRAEAEANTKDEKWCVSSSIHVASHRCRWHWSWSRLRMTSSPVDVRWYVMIVLPSLNWKRQDTYVFEELILELFNVCVIVYCLSCRTGTDTVLLSLQWQSTLLYWWWSLFCCDQYWVDSNMLSKWFVLYTSFAREICWFRLGYTYFVAWHWGQSTLSSPILVCGAIISGSIETLSMCLW